MTVAEWLAQAQADALRRNLPQLPAILEGLAKAMTTLRAADWNEGADEPLRDVPVSRSTWNEGGEPHA